MNAILRNGSIRNHWLRSHITYGVPSLLRVRRYWQSEFRSQVKTPKAGSAVRLAHAVYPASGCGWRISKARCGPSIEWLTIEPIGVQEIR